MSKFYIGQKIVAIKDHSQGQFKKGDVFTVLNITKKCCRSLVDIGLKRFLDTAECSICGSKYQTSSNSLFAESCFAPIELSETTFVDVISILNKDLILN